MSEPVVVITGANGLVGSRTCAVLVGHGATVRAVVRRPGAAPPLAGVEEWVGDFHNADFAGSVVRGASAVVTTVHPMGSDRATQHRIAVEGTPVIARAARDAGVARLVHVSTHDPRPSARPPRAVRASTANRSPRAAHGDDRWWGRPGSNRRPAGCKPDALSS